MKKRHKIKGRAIALLCVDDEGTYMLNKGDIYLGVPSSQHHSFFDIYIPNFKNKFHTHYPFETILYPKHQFIPVNPSHKHDPRYY